jgi:hypothetical protein
MSTTPPPTVAVRYQFTGNDRTVWLGLRPLPLAALVAAVFATVGGLYVGVPLPVAVVVLVIGVMLALVPVAGQCAAEWVAPLARRSAATLAARQRWSSGPGEVTPRPIGPQRVLRLPKEYGRLRLLDVEGGTVGMFDDPAARAYTVVLAVAGVDRFALLEPAEQARQLSGWGTALSALAADPEIRRVQWVQRSGPDLRDPAAWLRDRARTTVDAVDAVADYTAMTRQLTESAGRHEVWLAVQLARRTGEGRVGARPAVADRVREIAATLLAADLLARPLPAAEMGWLLRRFTDHAAAEEASAGFDGQVGPSSRRIGWSELRTDDSWHRSFAVTGWPRVPVPAGWLEPLLATASLHAVRTVALHLTPVPPGVAARETRAARTRARLDGADRTRLGFGDNASTAWAEADAASTEEELLAGYRLHRIAGIVTCTADSLAALDDACRSVRAAASAARVDLRPLHGQHDVGFLASLPLCRVNGRAR